MNQTRKLLHLDALKNCKEKLISSLSKTLDEVVEGKLDILNTLEESNYKFSDLNINYNKISQRIHDAIKEEIILSFVELHSKEQLLQKQLNLVRGYDWKQTYAICAHYLEYYEDDIFFMSYQVESLQNMKRENEAKEIIEKILSRVPFCKEDYFAIGKTYGLQQNYDNAFPFIQKSVEMNFIPAHVYIGWMYENGHGCQVNLAETLKHNTLASNDSSVAQYNLGLIYYYEKGVAKDRDEALKWWQKSSLAGYKRSDYYMGILYFEEKDYTNAFYYFSKAAEAGEPLSYVYLGEMYKYGYGTSVDTQNAFHWFERSAVSDDLSGILNLALCYYHGIGIDQSPENAFKWHKVGTDKGCVVSQYNLGLHYLYGYGCTQSYALSFDVFLKSAQNGYEVAQRQVASFYMRGDGVDQDYHQGLLWMRKCISKSPGEFKNADVFHSVKEIVLEVVKMDGSLLQFASDELKEDKEVAIIALSQNLSAQEFISPNLKQDLDIFTIIHGMYSKLRPKNVNFIDVLIFCPLEKSQKYEIFENTKERALSLYDEFTNEQSRVLRFLHDKTNDLLAKMESLSPDTDLDLEEIERVNELMRSLMNNFNK